MGTIYESGVILVEFRAIGPERDLSLEEFINGAVNLYKMGFDRAEVPPGLARIATHAWYHSKSDWRPHHRAMLWYLERQHALAVQERTVDCPAGDFTFPLAPLSSSEDEDTQETLAGLALTIMNAVRFLAAEPRRGASFVLQGQRKLPELGGLWTGRPHIYLVDFEDRQETSDANVRRHERALALILNRQYIAGNDPPPFPLPPDARRFSDFSSFVSVAATLWVWSSSGVRRQEPWADRNRGQLIYEHQALVELLEYGYMLHRVLLEAIPTLARQEDVITAQESLLDLEERLERASHFGELREWLGSGWRELGLDRLKERVSRSLALREGRLSMLEHRRNEKVGRGLAVLFGLLAVPALAEQVVGPLWQVSGLPRPTSPEGFTLVLSLIAIAVIGLVVWYILRSLGGDDSGGA